jgi:hypothetical protein
MIDAGSEGGIGGEKEAKAARLFERAKAAHNLLLLASAVRLLEAGLIFGTGGLEWQRYGMSVGLCGRRKWSAGGGL